MSGPTFPAVKVTRENDAGWINRVLNDPLVRPFVADMKEGVLDMSAALRLPANFVVRGEFGAFFVTQLMPGIYEVHTQVLREGRGAWAKGFMLAGMQWLFTTTNAQEIITRVPQGHVAARVAALQSGFHFECGSDRPMSFRGKDVPFDIYSLSLTEWVARAPGLVETGEWLHERFRTEARRLGFFEGTPEYEASPYKMTMIPHVDMPVHNRYVGVVYHMSLQGQMDKGVGLYNRWALGSHRPIERLIKIIPGPPPAVRFDITDIYFTANGDIRMALAPEILEANGWAA